MTSLGANPLILAAVLTLVGTCITVAGGLLLARMLRPNELIDQLQEERGVISARLSTAEKKIETVVLRQRYWEDYVNELRSHIERGSPPPPPPYPAALLRINLDGGVPV